MAYEWDPTKAAANRRKHGVFFAQACSVLEDELALTFEDLSSEGERRWLSLGTDALGRVLVVAYTWRNDNIRLISARLATRSERKQYEEQR